MISFIKILLLGFLSGLAIYLIKKLEKAINFHCFYVNIVYFCTFLMIGALFFMLISKSFNFKSVFWGSFAFVLGAILYNLVMRLVKIIVKNKNN